MLRKSTKMFASTVASVNKNASSSLATSTVNGVNKRPAKCDTDTVVAANVFTSPKGMIKTEVASVKRMNRLIVQIFIKSFSNLEGSY